MHLTAALPEGRRRSPGPPRQSLRNEGNLGAQDFRDLVTTQRSPSQHHGYRDLVTTVETSLVAVLRATGPVLSSIGPVLSAAGLVLLPPSKFMSSKNLVISYGRKCHSGRSPASLSRGPAVEVGIIGSITIPGSMPNEPSSFSTSVALD